MFVNYCNLKYFWQKQIMNEEKIKELFAVNYIRLLAEYAGFYVTVPGQDYGTDLHIEEMTHLSTGEYIPTGKIISLQIKSTTEGNVLESAEYLKYDLAVRNYNILVQRKYYTNSFKRYSPYILITVILPKNKEEWIREKVHGQPNLKVKGYWYYPNEQNEISKNLSSKRIEIPIKNSVNLEIFHKLFNLLWSKNQNL